MPELKTLSIEQREVLRRELAREDLAIYTVVRMASEEAFTARARKPCRWGAKL